jgi:predicted enzyme related to lactoylglutathione lyase
MVKSRYVHTNIIARDWKSLASFYEDIFDCKPVPPKRELTGKLIDDLTHIEHAELQGIHLKLPGYDEAGPLLEILQYSHPKKGIPAINRLGLAHIAFRVDDVESAKNEVLEAGGRAIGETVSLQIPKAGTVTVVYVTDPEGNIIELQHWS